MKKPNKFIVVMIVILMILSLKLIENKKNQKYEVATYFKKNLVTEHFIFHFNKSNNIDEYALFLESFLDFINKEYYSLTYDDYPIDICILPNKKEFKNYMLNKFNYDRDLYGLYSFSEDTFYTYVGSGLGTLTHELMHPLLNKNFPNRPTWTNEGIPAFFEKFFGYWSEKELFIDFGYQNPWRIEKLENKLMELSLEDIITKPSEDTSELRLVSVFLDKNNLFKKYLKLVKDNDKRGYNTFIEATFDKEFEKIRPIWNNYLKEVYMHRRKIYSIPLSTILDSKKEYDDYVKKNNLNNLKKY